MLVVVGLFGAKEAIHDGNDMMRRDVAIEWDRTYELPSRKVDKFIEGMLDTDRVRYSKTMTTTESGRTKTTFTFTGALDRTLKISVQPNDPQDTASYVVLTSSMYGHDNTVLRERLDSIMAEDDPVGA